MVPQVALRGEVGPSEYASSVEPEPVKKCIACGQLKTFHRTRASYCKDCCKEHDRAWRARNPDKVKARTKKRTHSPAHKRQTSIYRAVRRRTDPTFREREIIQSRRNKLKNAYGLTLEDFEAMKSTQNNLCAICGKPNSVIRLGRVRDLSVDHDHKTEKVRALLCYHCNSGLGHFRDDVEVMAKAITYLNHHAGKSSASA
jgi:hypothetical protein